MKKRDSTSDLKKYICSECGREYLSFMKLERCYRCIGREAYFRKEKEKREKKSKEYFSPPRDKHKDEESNF